LDDRDWRDFVRAEDVRQWAAVRRFVPLAATWERLLLDLEQRREAAGRPAYPLRTWVAFGGFLLTMMLFYLLARAIPCSGLILVAGVAGGLYLGLRLFQLEMLRQGSRTAWISPLRIMVGQRSHDVMTQWRRLNTVRLVAGRPTQLAFQSVSQGWGEKQRAVTWVPVPRDRVDEAAALVARFEQSGLAVPAPLPLDDHARRADLWARWEYPSGAWRRGSRYEHLARLRGNGPYAVTIHRDRVIVGANTFALKSRTTRLEDVVREESALLFQVREQIGNSSSRRVELRVPIPVGLDDEADQIYRRFQHQVLWPK
jgi:hypothetical protein